MTNCNTRNTNAVLVEGDLRSTLNNASDVLSLLACLDFEQVGSRRGADYGVFLVMETLADTLDAAANRSAEADESDQPRPLTVDLSDHEAAMLAQIAAKEGRDLDAAATALLSGALQRHAAVVSGGAA